MGRCQTKRAAKRTKKRNHWNKSEDSSIRSYGARKLIDDYSYIFLKNDRIGIIGPKRMDYKKVVKTLKNLTEELDDIFKDKS